LRRLHDERAGKAISDWQIGGDGMNDKILISAVKNARAIATHTLTLHEVVEEITGGKHAAIMARIREHAQAGRKAEASALKKTLPAVMFAGVFKSRRSDALEKHSGLLVLDFDGCGTDRKVEIAADPHVVLAFVSPSGNGLKVVVSVEADAALHGQSFDAALAYFREHFGLDADPSGRDLARLCFVSHDPGAILKTSSMTCHIEDIEDIEDKEDLGNKGAHNTPPPPPTDAPPALCVLCDIETILKDTQPTAPGQRHRKLFKLARGLRFEAGLADKPFAELKPIVRRWYDMALKQIGTQNFTETWTDFIIAWPRATTPLFQSSLSSAWTAAQADDPPPEAADYDHPDVQRLVCLCWQLARHKGTFYLSMHSAAGLLGVHAKQVQRWLLMLQAEKLLAVVKPGNTHTATTYSWKGNQKAVNHE
jgi:hypothetical protein